MVVRVDTDIHLRPAVSRTLPFYLFGLARPKPDPSDGLTGAAGIFKRVGLPPRYTRAFLSRVREKSLEVSTRLLVPLHVGVNDDFEMWAANSNYTLKRIEDLRQALEIWPFSKPREYVESFRKDENYQCYKYVRWINARCDRTKASLGPRFKLIEDSVFHCCPWFIKHVKEWDRPDFIADRVCRPGANYGVSDYSAYESHFTPEAMLACEFVMYEYMVQYVPWGDEFLAELRDVLLCYNPMHSRRDVFRVHARMSGEMNTSLGNGWSNLIFMLVCFELNGNTNVSGVVEGDDGLFSYDGPELTAGFLASQGLNVKMETITDFNMASFCGLVFDEVDRQATTDPYRAILSFGWTSRQYVQAGEKTLMALLRAKALSYRAMYSSCPVLWVMTRSIVRLTEDVKPWRLVSTIKKMRLSTFEKEWFLDSVNKPDDVVIPPTLATRLVVAKKFGVSIEVQLELEHFFASMTELGPFVFEAIRDVVHEHCADYFMDYTFEFGTVDPLSDARPYGTVRLDKLLDDHWM